MGQPVVPLLYVNLRSWFSAKGFYMVTAAALLPLVFTGAWVATHKVDVAAVELVMPDGDVVEGANVTFTATVTNVGGFDAGAFNASLAVGRVVGNTLRPDAVETTRIEGLAQGESREVTLRWTAKPGTYVVLADADSEDLLAEIEEFNNQLPKALSVRYASPNASSAPARQEDLNGTGAADVDLVVASVQAPSGLAPGANGTLRATIRNDGAETAENATLALRVGQSFEGVLFPLQESTETVTLAPGESKELTLTWRAREGVYWVEASANPGAASADASPDDNHRAEPLVVQPVAENVTFPTPPEKITIKRFYLDILALLHLRILLPFIGLFYAAGVIADERERGTLAYLLTRPLPRWLVPLTKFLASFLVASVAVAIGIVATFFLLLGTPQGNVGFLTTPLLASLVALFVYGALFTLLGVYVDRPYLVGVAFVIGWETVAANFVPWVQNLTLSHHIGNVIQAWPLDQGFVPLPEGDGVAALRNVLVAAVVFLGLAAYTMRQREFDV